MEASCSNSVDDARNKLFANIEKHMLYATKEEHKKFQKIQYLIRCLDLSVIKPELIATTDHQNEDPTTSRPLKKKLKSSRKNILITNRSLKETAQQIGVVREILDKMYKIQEDRFTRMISKRGDDVRGGLTARALLEYLMEKGKRLPLWLGRQDEGAPPLCGCIDAKSDHIAKDGDLVAAFAESGGEQNWILTEVVFYDPGRKKYIVDDIFEDYETEFCVNRSEIICLPQMRANPKTSPEALFPNETRVLALMPQTTCFYPGLVAKKPQHPTDPYDIEFESNLSANNYLPAIPVEQGYVVKFRSNVVAAKAKKKYGRRRRRK